MGAPQKVFSPPFVVLCTSEGINNGDNERQ